MRRLRRLSALFVAVVGACGDGHHDAGVDSGLDAGAAADAGDDGGSCADAPRDRTWDVDWPDAVDDAALAADRAMELVSGHWGFEPAACTCPANDCPGVLEGTEQEGWEVREYWATADGTGPFLRMLEIGKRESELDGSFGRDGAAGMHLYRKALEAEVVGMSVRHEPSRPYMPLVGFVDTAFVWDLCSVRFESDSSELVAACDSVAFVAPRLGAAEPFGLLDPAKGYASFLGDDDGPVLEAMLQVVLGWFPDYEQTGVLEALTRAMENLTLLPSTRREVAAVVLQAAENADTLLPLMALDRLLGRLRLDPDAEVRDAVAVSLNAALADGSLGYATCDLRDALAACADDEASGAAQAACAEAVARGITPEPACP